MSVASHGVALLLVDLQYDFLERPGLTPDPGSLCARAAVLLDGVRRQGIPVAHAHTVIQPDGTDRMPHWQRGDVWQCVEGTRGVLPPPALSPAAGELVLRKRFFSAFGGRPDLDAWFRARDVTQLIVAGIYVHSCVRATVLDAYERGYAVTVADDAVGTTEPLHSELTRTYLAERAASFCPVDDILARFDTAGAALSGGQTLPVAVIAATPRTGTSRDCLAHRNPCRTAEILWRVPRGTAADIEDAARTSADAARPWALARASTRADFLDRWADELVARRELLTDLIIREVAKPRRFAEEEVGRAVAHARIAAELARDPAQSGVRIAPGVATAQRPLGVVGLVTPWNNPLAIPIGKIAPALAFGNGVLLKPAPPASATAVAILESLTDAGLTPGIVNLVLGDGDTTRALCRTTCIDAISLTGSVATGRAVAAYCASAMKPLQAELGGNNAAIILHDVELETVVPDLVRAAFGFAGQRCTAVRRFIVEHAVAARFEGLAVEAARGLKIGEPNDASTEVGPLISEDKRKSVAGLVARAVADGARLLSGGGVPAYLAHGAWMEPALLAEHNPYSHIAQDESFAPVAVILRAADLEEALRLANGVPQGLLLSVHTNDPKARARVLEAAQVGIVQLGTGPLAVHPRAPFSGWKASGLGPPEHGIWDAAFYARTQAVYGQEPC